MIKETNIKMESGGNKNPTLDTLKKIAKVLGVSIEKTIKQYEQTKNNNMVK